MPVATTANLNATTPAAPSGSVNLPFADDAGSPTVNISVAAPIATTSILGLVKPDGTSIIISSGVISTASGGGSGQTTVSGSVSGSAVFSQPSQGPYSKKILIVLESLSGTASYTFPTAFTQASDYFIGASASGATVTALSTTAVTISGAPSSGVIVLEGF